MKSKITQAFFSKDGCLKKAFLPFISAGDPDLDSTLKYILTLEKAGAALVQVGIPFSDPIADGPVITEANLRALKAGTTITKIFDMLEKLRTQSSVPIAFFTYLNPVFNFGYEEFFKKCKETGVSGIIIPDLPFEEREEVLEYCEKYDVDLIPFIFPSSNDRIEKIAKNSTGFIYVASEFGSNKAQDEIEADLCDMIKRAKNVSDTPCAVGFGVGSKEQAKCVKNLADGVIMGSAIEEIIAKYGTNAEKPLYEFAKTIVEC